MTSFSESGRGQRRQSIIDLFGVKYLWTKKTVDIIYDFTFGFLTEIHMENPMFLQTQKLL